MDGTFSHCSKFFTQLFTIHIINNRNYILVISCLLPNKLQYTYECLLKLICEPCSQLNYNINPKAIIIDYELAIHNAVASYGF